MDIIENDEQKDSILLKLGQVWIKSKRLEKAEQIINNIQNNIEHAEALIDLLLAYDPHIETYLFYSTKSQMDHKRDFL